MISAAPSEPRRSKAEKFWDRLARTWGKPTEESDQTDTKVLAKTGGISKPPEYFVVAQKTP
jgi:hypothetical protein